MPDHATLGINYVNPMLRSKSLARGVVQNHKNGGQRISINAVLVQHGDSGWTRLHGCRSARVHRMGKALGVDHVKMAVVARACHRSVNQFQHTRDGSFRIMGRFNPDMPAAQARFKSTAILRLI